MTSSHHGPYVLGHTRATMAGTERSEAGTRSESQKAGLSTDCSLQLDCMKMESLVIAHQHGAVNMFPGLVHTARHTIRVGGTRSRQPDRKGGGSEGTSGEGGEVVTRSPYRKVRLDHLLSSKKGVVRMVSQLPHARKHGRRPAGWKSCRVKKVRPVLSLPMRIPVIRRPGA